MSEQDSNWKYADDIVIESEAIGRARSQSLEFGLTPVSPALGAQLAVFAAASRAANIIEIGTGAGVSGLWLLEGSATSVLTTIDHEPEHLAAAKQAFADAGIPSSRLRLIGGPALDVLTRMNENSYDIVLVDADPAQVIETVEHALRLVRPGGTVLVPHALWQGHVADPAKRDDITTAFRTLVEEIAASSAVVSALSPAGDGLLQLTIRA
ncbi:MULTISPECIES: O-methyltransferase [Mycetocola]|uniref:Methyltransferase domain-containing protein n=1 Tax=Mycetocola lacteus TaxID=76637 RepID=A0A3L7AVM9_9MICO|nr:MULTISPECIES: class I SAM-dependent methyltransferase [Mycetocola]MCS4275523.1 putative O-methyltransferase YrrM [Mycetocola sp. BIGb0189]RLP80782.1 methyltransferase domain-containing protein [Mycetocola lacteus]RLP84567.1 methyltransferase domain-containing protein [Mycetocola lacteus]